MSALNRFFPRHPGHYGYLKFAVVVGGVLLAFGLALALWAVLTPVPNP